MLSQSSSWRDSLGYVPFPNFQGPNSNLLLAPEAFLTGAGMMGLCSPRRDYCSTGMEWPEVQLEWALRSYCIDDNLVQILSTIMLPESYCVPAPGFGRTSQPVRVVCIAPLDKQWWLANVPAIETATYMSFPRMCCSCVAEQECLFILCVWCLQAKHQLMIELKALVVIVRTLPWAFWLCYSWIPLVQLVEWHTLRAASLKKMQEMAIAHLVK